MQFKIKKEIQKYPFFFLIMSFILHLVLVLFFGSSWNLFKKDIVITPSAVRVDVVGLPELASQRKEITIKTEKSVFISDKKLQKKSLQKKQKKKEISKKKKAVETKKSSIKTKEQIKKETNKANQIMEGESDGEESLTEKQIEEVSNYMNSVSSQMKEFWNLPKYLTDVHLVAQVEIQINVQGEIVSTQIVSSSGNLIFDSRVLKAMESASPYPPPPSNVKQLISEGIVVTLSSQD